MKQGQLLAEIDAPEVADQLRQARADEATAAANFALAKTTADRWKDLQASNSVAQQETDQKVADMQAKTAVLASARSNTARLAVVGHDGRLEIRHVALGRDFGSHVEVLSGLAGSEQVIVNPGDGLVAGTAVQVIASAGGANRSVQ